MAVLYLQSFRQHNIYSNITNICINWQYRFGDKDYLGFEELTLVPFEPNLIKYELLSKKEVNITSPQVLTYGIKKHILYPLELKYYNFKVLKFIF